MIIVITIQTRVMANSLKKTFLLALTLLVMLNVSTLAHAQMPELEEFISQSRTNTANFKSRLSRIRDMEIETLGLPTAVEVCRIMAPQLYLEFSVDRNILLRRVSLRPRNVIKGHADAWEQAGLLKMHELAGNKEKSSGMEIAELVEEPAGKYFRYLSPIIASPQCMKCHGSATEIDSRVVNILQHHYPGDQATGYQVGDLMGAITIKQALSSFNKDLHDQPARCPHNPLEFCEGNHSPAEKAMQH